MTVQVTDANGLVSAPQSIHLKPVAPPTSHLFALNVGNDQYADPRLKLNYAAHDAERLAAVLAANPGGAYASTDVKALTNGAATRDAISEELGRVIAAARPEDTIVFFFAGHGVDSDEGYYLTPSGFDPKHITDTGLAWRELASMLSKAKARVIVILDACHAGRSGSEGLGTNDGAVAALLSQQHPPMLVLAASKGRQLSQEDVKWDGGVFTYALIQALQNRRADYDIDHDGAIDISELYRALRTIVGRETNGQQSPWLVREDLIGDFAVF